MITIGLANYAIANFHALIFINHRTASDLMEVILQTYKYALPRTTAYTVIADEKKLLEKEIKDEVEPSKMKSFHSKVDIVTYLAEYENAKDSLKNHNMEPSLLGKNGRPYLFHPTLYPDLIARLNEVVDVVGFGPALVATMVSIVLKTLHRTGDDESVYEPSLEWSRWFLRTKMGLVKRRVTSYTYTPEERTKQEMLHKLNLDHLAKMIADDGLTPDFIFCTDELGVNLQPEGVERWVKKGSKVVSSALSKDKRAFTANIIANASGDLVAHHQIFAGKTDACLPSEDVMIKYKEAGYIFSHSENHWNNQSLKLAELSAIHNWKVQKYLK